MFRTEFIGLEDDYRGLFSLNSCYSVETRQVGVGLQYTASLCGMSFESIKIAAQGLPQCFTVASCEDNKGQ